MKDSSLLVAELRSHCRSDTVCWACRYVVVTRPVRQGRLKLALEEVLSMTVDTPTSRSAPGTTSHVSAFMDLATTYHCTVRLRLPFRQQFTFGLSGLRSLGASNAPFPSGK